MAGTNKRDYYEVLGVSRGVQEADLKKAYRIIFRNGLPLKEALQQVEEQLGQDRRVMYLIHFIQNSQRGIAR
jgi:UDP-N-acetylglucosamine acyltransferase